VIPARSLAHGVTIKATAVTPANHHIKSRGGFLPSVLVDPHSGPLIWVLREIRRLGLGFFEVDSVFLKKSQPGASTVDAPGCVFFLKNGVDLEKPQAQTSDLGVIWGGRR
jgi:hypothetical protein